MHRRGTGFIFCRLLAYGPKCMNGLFSFRAGTAATGHESGSRYVLGDVPSRYGRCDLVIDREITGRSGASLQQEASGYFPVVPSIYRPSLRLVPLIAASSGAVAADSRVRKRSDLSPHPTIPSVIAQTTSSTAKTKFGLSNVASQFLAEVLAKNAISLRGVSESVAQDWLERSVTSFLC